jgi:hypothetical protein
VSLVAQELVWMGCQHSESCGVTSMPAAQVGTRKGLWYETLNRSDIVERRNAFLGRVYTLLLEEQVFCKDSPGARVHLMSQESRYNYGQFMRTDCYGGGTTYMEATHANQFVRVHNDNINNPAFRVSVRPVGDQDMNCERECVWQCVVEVIVWWQTERPGSTGQSLLSAEALRTVPGYTFMVGGGPLLHVLIALYYAYFRVESLGKHTDLAVESYGTKKLHTVSLLDPSAGIVGPEDVRVDSVVQELEDALDEVAPMQLKRLKLFLDRYYVVLDGSTCELVWGIGCTLQCETVDGQGAWPVIQCGDVPWKSLLDEGDPTKFFAEAATVRGDTKLFPFVPLQSKHAVTWPIYGCVLPLCMQPTTFTAKGTGETALGGRGRAEGLQSVTFRRLQQYNVTARFAAGEYGLQRKTTARLSELPGHVVPQANELTINLAILQNKVVEFQRMARAHLAAALQHAGGWARIEIAVPVRTGYGSDDGETRRTFRSAVHDAVLLAQNNTVGYDAQTWSTLIEFFVGALPSRVRCTVDMMAKTSEDAREDVLRQDELADYTLEVVDVIKRFYNGVGCMRTKMRSLPRCSYVYDRAILGRVRKYGNMQRNQYLYCGGTDWLEKFYEKLGMVKADAISIPDYVPAERHRRISQHVVGFACPYCWNLYRPKERYAFSKHPCQGRHLDWVELTGEKFKRHHLEALGKLTDEQKLLIELLDDPALNPNVYLGGLGGVGKSFAVRVVVEHICLKYGMNAIAVIAPTHIAAQNVGGRTIHSFLGLTHTDSLVPKADDFDKVVSRFLKGKDAQARELQNNLQFLVVEEVGMLAANTLALLEYFVRSLKRTGLEGEEVGNFGDVKTLLVGDPLQLPPVDIVAGGGYFFESEAFTAKESRFVALYLKKMFRTPDVQFLNFQERSRLGEDYLTEEHVEYANRALGTEVVARDTGGWLEATSQALHTLSKTEQETDKKMDVKMTWYFCKKSRMTGKTERMKSTGQARDTAVPVDPSAGGGNTPPERMPYTICVERVEGAVLDSLYLQSFKDLDAVTVLLAEDKGGTVPDTAKLIARLELAVGMRVRVLTNDHAPMVPSNSVVDVVRIDAERVTVSVPQATGTAVQAEIMAVRENFQLMGKMVTRVQFPLSPCGSGTTYQVQGQTLRRRCCVFSNERIKRGDFGQAYTVISRHTDPAYIKALHDWDRSDFQAAEVAIRFDQFHAQQENCVTDVTYSFPVGAKGDKRVLTCHLQQAPGKACPCMMCCGRAELRSRTLGALEATEAERQRIVDSTDAVCAAAEEEDGCAGWNDGDVVRYEEDDTQVAGAAPDTEEAERDGSAGLKRGRNVTDDEDADGKRQRRKPELPIVRVGTLETPAQAVPAFKPWLQRAVYQKFTDAEQEWLALSYAALTSTKAEKQVRQEKRWLMKSMLKKQGEVLVKAMTEFEQLYYLWNQKFNWGVTDPRKRRPRTLETLRSKVGQIRRRGLAGEMTLKSELSEPEQYPPYTDVYVTQSGGVYGFEGCQGQKHCLSEFVKNA